MSLYKKDILDIYIFIRNKMSEEDLKRIKEKYPNFEDIGEDNSVLHIERAILMLIEKL